MVVETGVSLEAGASIAVAEAYRTVVAGHAACSTVRGVEGDTDQQFEIGETGLRFRRGVAGGVVDGHAWGGDVGGR